MGKFDSDAGITFYALYYGGYGHNTFHVIVGQRADGKWAKYIDTRDIVEQYYGKGLYWADMPLFVDDVRTEGDVVVMPYRWQGKNGTVGEFRFKWDEAAQWFGVELVKF